MVGRVDELNPEDRYHSTMRFVLLMAGALLLAPALAAENLPDLGDASQADFSPQAEHKLGETIMRDIRLDSNYYDDPEIVDYLNNLGYRLASHSPNNRQDFEFFLVKDNTINAFALPGGFIGVHTGLLLAAQTESELAGVLAHEISHVTQRHLARMVAQQQRTTLPSLAALALAILAARSNTQVAGAAIATVQATAIQNQLDFTRENEREADRIGLQTLEAAGFDPRGMETFFERLQKFNRLYENNAPAYLRTHPLTTERIADIENRVAALPYRQVPDSLEFQLVRAKLRAAAGSSQEAVSLFDDSLREHKYSNEVATRYGLVAALIRAKQYPRAEKELAALRKLMSAPHPMVELLGGELKEAEGQTSSLIPYYREAIKRFPYHRALVYAYARALLNARDPVTVLGLVDGRLRATPSDYRLYELQAEAYAEQGKRLLQHRALGESQALRGNLPAAVEQLQIALKAGDGDFYQLSSTEARLRELRAQDRESRRQ
jgi:predicted Zn-dependent protease